MFERFTISLPADFINQPEKVYRSLMLKQCLEDTVDPEPEAELEAEPEDSMVSTEYSFENVLRSQLVSNVSIGDTTNTNTSIDPGTDIEVTQAFEAVNISHDSVG